MVSRQVSKTHYRCGKSMVQLLPARFAERTALERLDRRAGAAAETKPEQFSARKKQGGSFAQPKLPQC